MQIFDCYLILHCIMYNSVNFYLHHLLPNFFFIFVYINFKKNILILSKFSYMDTTVVITYYLWDIFSLACFTIETRKCFMKLNTNIKNII